MFFLGSLGTEVLVTSKMLRYAIICHCLCAFIGCVCVFVVVCMFSVVYVRMFTVVDVFTVVYVHVYRLFNKSCLKTSWELAWFYSV